MTDVREELARLTIHGPQLDRIGYATNPDRLTTADVGHALGMGLTRQQARLLLAKYCDDVAEQRMFAAEFFDWVLTRAEFERWHRPKIGMIHGLAYAAAGEFLGANRCPKCDGAHIRGTVTCPHCVDTPGYRYPTEQEYAKAIGCTISAYRAVWSARVALCRRELARLEYSALAKYAEIMADDD